MCPERARKERVAGNEVLGILGRRGSRRLIRVGDWLGVRFGAWWIYAYTAGMYIVVTVLRGCRVGEFLVMDSMWSSHDFVILLEEIITKLRFWLVL